MLTAGTTPIAGGVADGWLPHTARAMAHLVAQGMSRAAAATPREFVLKVMGQPRAARPGVTTPV